MKTIASATVTNNCNSNTQRNGSAACIFSPKPQISSIPGVSPKEKFRYQIVLNGKVLSSGLSLEQALERVGLQTKGVGS